jgi:hypothetical protein
MKMGWVIVIEEHIKNYSIKSADLWQRLICEKTKNEGLKTRAIII